MALKCAPTSAIQLEHKSKIHRELRMKKLAVIISSILLSSAATTAIAADTYQSVSNLGYQYTDSNNDDQVSIDSTYYFSPKVTLGPFDEFEYINKQSNVFGAYTNNDASNVTSIGGEYFVDNFVVGASYLNNEFGSNDESYSFTAGYFLAPELLAKAKFVEGDAGDDYALFSVAYTHLLNGTDYVGITVETDDEFDYRSVSAKYFVDLQEGNFLTVEGTFESISEADDQWNVETNYYFSKATSVFASYNREDAYSFGAQHFFDQNIGLKVGYGNNAGDSDNDTYFAKMRFQF